MLTSAGWTPGNTLGAKDAAHAEHYTAASASHIRVLPCVNGKGLGSKKTTDETFGLRLLTGLLGRLNGKDMGVVEEQLDRRRGEGYLEERGWGLNFVFGGYLVGDRIEKDKAVALALGAKKDVVEKKRKRQSEEEDEADRKDKRRRKDEKKARKAQRAAASGAVAITTKAKETISVLEDPSLSEKSEDQSKAKLHRKEEKRRRKEARRLKKEQRRSKTLETSLEQNDLDQDITQGAHDRVKSTSSTASVPSAPASAAVTPVFAARGRHAMRQKYIDQKRAFMVDNKAMNEVSLFRQTYTPFTNTRIDIHDQIKLGIHYRSRIMSVDNL